MINLFCCYSDLSKLQNIVFSRDDTFPEVGIRKGFDISQGLEYLPLRQHDRKDVGLWTVKPVPFAQVAESHMHSLPMASTSYQNEKSIDALKQFF